MSVISMFSSINQAKTHKYEFKHFIYEKKARLWRYKPKLRIKQYRKPLLISPSAYKPPPVIGSPPCKQKNTSDYKAIRI